mgnify:CR=1 FL=1
MRIEGWESKLDAYVKEAFAKPFQWGTHDCALWTEEWVRIATGDNFVSEFFGRYTNEKTAISLLKKKGFRRHTDIADHYLEPIDSKTARRGDLLLHPVKQTLGICIGLYGAFPTEPHGVVISKTTNCPKAWRV